VRTDHAGKDGGKKQGQRGSSAKNDDVDIVYRLDKSDDGLTLKRTHTRISWVPETVSLIVEDFDDVITIRLRTKQQRGWTVKEIEKAKELESLGIPIDLSVREVKDKLRELGIVPGNNTTLNNAIACRKQPSPDPLGTTNNKKAEPLGTTQQNGNTSGTTSETLPEALGVQGNQRVYWNSTRGSVPQTETQDNREHPTPAHPNPDQLDHQDNLESELW
jgi:hypothetical protein